MKLLIVEDEPDLMTSISDYMEAAGFLCEQAPNFFTAEDKLAGHTYDVIILDITLPDGNGLDLLKQLKNDQPETGILIVSAKNSLDDKLKGLDLGADDYITKPFHLAELNARINAIIRRKTFKGKANISFREIELDPLAKEVTVNNRPVILTKKEYELLLYFITNKNRVVTKQAIAEHLWGDHLELADDFDFIYTHIKNLRKKIEQQGGEDYLKTIYGLGYKFTDR